VVLADGERWRAAAGTVSQPFQAPGTRPETKAALPALMAFVGTQAPLNSQNRHPRIAPALASSRHHSPPDTQICWIRVDGWVICVIRKSLTAKTRRR